MENSWLQIREQFLQAWNKMNITQKVIILSAVITIMTTIVILGRMAAKPDMVPLFTDLHSSDAGAIMSRLEDMNSQYQLADGGTTILVPNRDRDRLRIQLAMDDLPRRGVVGFESWSEPVFGETETNKRVRMLVALQGELTRTIESMTEVEAARVHIAIPEPKLFTSDTSDPTASIMVRLRPFAQLNSEQVLAIMRLVANSVEDLNPEQVVVVDSNMNILSEDIAESQVTTAAKLTATQLQLKEQFETNLASSIQSMLQTPLGYGNVVVRVSADLNFDEIESRRQEFGPNSITRSEYTLEESSSGTTPGVGGEVGMDANQGLAALDPATSEYERIEQTINREIDVYEEYIKRSPGTIDHLSVSVIVNTGEELELSQERADMIRSAVASAAGIREDRNDNVEVIGLQFDTTAFQNMQDRLNEYEARQRILRWSIVAGVILAAAIAAGIYLRVVRARRAVIKNRQLETEVEETSQLTPEEKERDLMKRQIENLAKEKPSEVAHLLKTWLADDSR